MRFVSVVDGNNIGVKTLAMDILNESIKKTGASNGFSILLLYPSDSKIKELAVKLSDEIPNCSIREEIRLSQRNRGMFCDCETDAEAEKRYPVEWSVYKKIEGILGDWAKYPYGESIVDVKIRLESILRQYGCDMRTYIVFLTSPEINDILREAAKNMGII